MIDIAKILCPFPYFNSEGQIVHGMVFGFAPLCNKCDKTCQGILSWANCEGVDYGECEKGLSVVRFVFSDGYLICPGFLASGKNISCPPKTRKRVKSYKIKWEEIASWYQGIRKVFPVVQERAYEKARELFQSLHDVKSAVNILTRNAESLLMEQEGESVEEREDNAPEPLRVLHQSVSLLLSRLEMTTLVHDPDAARHGSRKPTPIYKLFHRLVRIYANVGARRRVFVKDIRGKSFNKPDCYDSFDTLAHCLIDNAVKYCNSGKEVWVNINDLGSGV